MDVGNACTLPQKETLIQSLGILCSQPSFAGDLRDYLYSELGIRPSILRVDELQGIEIVIVAEYTIEAAVPSVERVRQRGHRMPLMVITADDRPGVVERVFAAGADDFVTIPNRKAELPHRLIALRRRSSGVWTSKSGYIRPDVESDSRTSLEATDPPSTRGVVLMHGVRITFTARELAIFTYLKARYKIWVTAAELLSVVCECPQQRDTTLVRVHVSAIRRKLGAYGHQIESRRTYGYRWVGAPDEP